MSGQYIGILDTGKILQNSIRIDFKAPMKQQNSSITDTIPILWHLDQEEEGVLEFPWKRNRLMAIPSQRLPHKDLYM
ncbi:hypothetical protein L1887_29006 [Cichorium endivia]|nr:hypothetical protein L1887_29006 [Cichorium endivia]